jgi:hypothetical protein
MTHRRAHVGASSYIACGVTNNPQSVRLRTEPQRIVDVLFQPCERGSL